MKHQLTSQSGRALYALRKQTVEPVFGIIKQVMGLRQFSMRGMDKVAGEWTLATLAWNVQRKNVLRMACEAVICHINPHYRAEEKRGGGSSGYLGVITCAAWRPESHAADWTFKLCLSESVPDRLLVILYRSAPSSPKILQRRYLSVSGFYS
jgi:hypothetical protein